MEELCTLTGAIDGGSLEDVCGDALDTADEDQHVVAHGAENESTQHGPELHILAQPLDLITAQKQGDLIEQTEVIVEDVLYPHGRQCHGTDNIGQIDGGPEEFLAPDAAGQDDGEEQGNAQGDDTADQPDAEHIPHGALPAGACKQLQIVAQPIKLPSRDFSSNALDLEKAHNEGPDHGVHKHHKQG